MRLAAPGASGEADLVFASLTLTRGRPGTGQQNWVTGGTSYPGRCAGGDAANSKPADGLTGFTVISTPTPLPAPRLRAAWRPTLEYA